MFKAGDKVHRKDGYYAGVVVEVISDMKRMHPLYEVIIRQRRVDSKDLHTIVTRDADGNTASKLKQYQYLKG